MHTWLQPPFPTEQPAQNTLVVEGRERRVSKLYASNKLVLHIIRYTYIILYVRTYKCMYVCLQPVVYVAVLHVIGLFVQVANFTA